MKKRSLIKCPLMAVSCLLLMMSVSCKNSVQGTGRNPDDISNQKIYQNADSSDLYDLSDMVKNLPDDKVSVLEKYQLPSLERMSSQDSSELLGNSQVLKRIDVLKINKNDFYTPEYQWKKIYSDEIGKITNSIPQGNAVEFTGTKASELNQFLLQHSGQKVEVEAQKIQLDDTIKVPGNIALVGNQTELISNGKIDKAILIEKASNVQVDGFKITGGCQYGVYAIDVNQLLIRNIEASHCTQRGIVLMGDCSNVNLIKNYVHDNSSGGIFLDGNIEGGIIEGNTIFANKGARNLTAGMVVSSIIITDPNTANNQFQDKHLYDLVNAPHRLVIKSNTIQENDSSGIYSDGGYLNYILDNQILDNDKEGVCLDYGTFGSYLSDNRITQNGGRRRQMDTDLKLDFIENFGRLSDGSSPAKVPGISLDNAAYNIIENNIVSSNYGSGIKIVRSAYRNIFLQNTISDNNFGENKKFHFFGIELGYAAKSDEQVEGLDFTPPYENIISRNMITGAHYSGIFLAEESYCNDVFDNTILNPEHFSMECLSNKYNSSLNNYSDKSSRGIWLSDKNGAIIVLPRAVN